MNFDHSLLDFFINAGPVVKVVMLILLIASIMSWTFIFQRWSYLSKVARKSRGFEKKFNKTKNMTELYQTLSQKKNIVGLGEIFLAGYRDFAYTAKLSHINQQDKLQSVRSAMSVQQSRLSESLDTHLPFLATVASTSPYIGLFGTVWGIMTAFTALGGVQQASIAMVAPGISEALIATALGLFAAIPASIAFNRFSHRVETIMNRTDIFTEDLIRILGYQKG